MDPVSALAGGGSIDFGSAGPSRSGAIYADWNAPLTVGSSKRSIVKQLAPWILIAGGALWLLKKK